MSAITPARDDTSEFFGKRGRERVPQGRPCPGHAGGKEAAALRFPGEHGEGRWSTGEEVFARALLCGGATKGMSYRKGGEILC